MIFTAFYLRCMHLWSSYCISDSAVLFSASREIYPLVPMNICVTILEDAKDTASLMTAHSSRGSLKSNSFGKKTFILWLVFLPLKKTTTKQQSLAAN